MKKKLLCAFLALFLVAALLPGTELSASAAEMDVSQAFITLLKQYEGFYSKPYWDYSQYSIGYGSTCPPDMVDYYNANPLTEQQASDMLVEQLQEYIKHVRKFLNNSGKTVNQNQFDALVSFTYNCGWAWTTEETGYFHNAVEFGTTNSELLYGMCLFGNADGDYILISRRMSEANMYLNGVYDRQSYPSNFKYVFLDGCGGTPQYKINGYDSQEAPKPAEKFKHIPSGPDKTGAIVNYVFDGWYTARSGGTKVTALDGSLNDGAVLYAHWKLPDGTPVVIPQEETGVGIEVTITATDVNIRSGPGTYYERLRRSLPNEKIVVTLTAKSRGDLWGRFDGGWISLQYTNYSSVLSQVLPKRGTVAANGVKVTTAAGGGSTVTVKNTGDQVRVTQWTHSGNLMYGKIDEGWICLQNIQWNPGDYDGAVKSVQLLSAPAKTSYVQRAESLDLTGGKLLVTYEDGMTATVPMTSATVSGFDNSKIGPGKVTVTYAGKSVQFDVSIVKAVITFLDYNGTVLQTGEYVFSQGVTPPPDPVRPADGYGNYVFTGWSPQVTSSCVGSMTYRAQYILLGDVDGDAFVTEDDAIYLLYHVIFPEKYPLQESIDYTGDGIIDEDDAIFLLYHAIFPDKYPMIQYVRP